MNNEIHDLDKQSIDEIARLLRVAADSGQSLAEAGQSLCLDNWHLPWISMVMARVAPEYGISEKELSEYSALL